MREYAFYLLCLIIMVAIPFLSSFLTELLLCRAMKKKKEQEEKVD